MTHAIQRFVRAIDATSARAYLALFRERCALVPFLFHSLFRDDREAALNHVDPLERTTVAALRQLIEYYLRNGYRFVSPGDLLAGLPERGKYALLTFDDGYYNNVLALPILEEFRVPAVFFISTGHVRRQKCFWWDVLYRERIARGASPRQIYREALALKSLRTDRIEKRLAAQFGPRAFEPRGDIDRPFSPAELRDFAKSPWVHLGNHTDDHAILTNYDADAVREQVEAAQQWLRDLTGVAPVSIAYPNGAHDPQVERICAESGLRLGFTIRPAKTPLPLDARRGGGDLLRIGRFVPHSDTPIPAQCRTYRSDFLVYGMFRDLYLRFVRGRTTAPAFTDRCNEKTDLEREMPMPRCVRQSFSSSPSRCGIEPLETRELLSAAAPTSPAPIVRPDHIVVVIEEDRAANALGDPDMPYFNQLAANGLTYTNSHSVGRPSRLDYLALFSGSTQGVTDNYTDYPLFVGDNLARSLNTLAGASFVGYAETMPADGSLAWYAPDPADPDHHPDAYFRGYNPMAQFADFGPGRSLADVNRTFAAFPSDFATLPTVSFVIPNVFHNTHGSNEAPYTDASSDYDRLRINADAWLHANLDPYLQWARTHNSLLIVTGDEEDEGHNPAGGITTIVNGDPRLFVPGANASPIDHFNVLRTITDMYGLAPLGESAAVAPLDTNASGQLSPPTSGTSHAATTTTLASSAPSSGYGQAVTFTSRVSPSGGASGIPTGSVTFKDGGTTLGTAPLDGTGTATVVTSTLTVGAHSITAVYAGDAGFSASTSPALTQTVAVANDAFANRLGLSGSSVTATGSNVGATKETGEPRHAGNAGGKSVWWTWTAPSSGNVTIDTAGSTFDTLLGVYTGTRVSALTAVKNGSNDDSPAGGTYTSRVTVAVTMGTPYQIAVDGYGGASGNVTLHLAMAAPAPQAPTGVSASDGTFTDRIRVTWSATAGATAYEVWRNTTSSSGGAARIGTDIVATTFDDASAKPATTYWYWVKAKNASGTSALSTADSGRRATTTGAGPANNDFANRATLSGTAVTATGTNVGASKEAGEPNHGGNAGGRSVWWTWTAAASGTLTIDTLGSSFDTLLGVYTGSSVSALSAVLNGSNDDSPAGGTVTSRVTIAVTAGTHYQIAVDGYGGASGNITIHLRLS
jgi:peptidoglycan/xylan/chitin deacetylase (PgdA/CDA1 family)